MSDGTPCPKYFPKTSDMVSEIFFLIITDNMQNVCENNIVDRHKAYQRRT